MSIFYIDLLLQLPFFFFQKILACKTWRLSKNKYLEFQFDLTNTLFRFNLHWDAKRDHAGIRFEIALLCLSLMLSLFDNRHWDDDKNTWINYD